MACPQPPVPQQRTLVLKGVLDLPRTLRQFGGAMPLHAELDEMVRSSHPALLAHKSWLPARSGDILLYPERNCPFPALFRYEDKKAGMLYSMDTCTYMGIRGIALYMLRGTYRFRFQGNEMLFSPIRSPIILQFPQDRGWHPYDPNTFIPVSQGGARDAAGIMTGRFLQRADVAWLGCPARDINRGNNDEKEVFASDLPSTPRAVFAWEDAAPAQQAGEKPHRGAVQVPAIVPAHAPAPNPTAITGPPQAFRDAQWDWTQKKILHELDPRRYPDPGPPPMPEQYLPSPKAGKA